MAPKTIVTINCKIPGSLSEYIRFESKASLWDWDIILFRPSITDYMSWDEEYYQGKPLLNDNRSFQLKDAANHWSRELAEAFRAGKTIFVQLCPLREIYVDSGKREYSGSGKSRQTTRIVDLFNNYKTLPVDIKVTAAEGRAMQLTREGDFLVEYWKEFGHLSTYKVLLPEDLGIPLCVTKTGSKPVAAMLENPEHGGHIILLPYLELMEEDFYEELVVATSSNEEDEEYEDEDDDDDESGLDDFEESDEIDEEIVWTKKGNIFGHKLISSLCAIDDALEGGIKSTPIPDWATDDAYVLPKEAELQQELLKVEVAQGELAAKNEEIAASIYEERSLRRLLYENGHLLEKAVLKALQLLGFHAEQYRDSKSEFDVVFQCPEGRFLGEVEGKDDKPINVDKIRQLAMNVHEDFSRDDVAEIAKGVLFGNAYRLRALPDRGDYFTEKSTTAAKSSGIALVRTPDLFDVAKYLSNRVDDDFSKKCREAILSASGEVVLFPAIPTEDVRTFVRMQQSETK